jgi:basic membrane protein A and related proteins
MFKRMFRLSGVLIMTGALVTTLALAAGGSGATSHNNRGQAEKANHLSVAYVVAGTLGDLGFHDSANAGVKLAQQKLGATTKVIEGGVNASATWQSDLQALASSQQWNVIMCDTSFCTDPLTAVAKQFPNQQFLIPDQKVDLPNVVSIIYRQNDGAFLAGVLAALVTDHKTSAFPLASGSKTVGIIGGQNIPVINDFVVGFKKGVKVIDPSIKVLVSYVGNFVDAQTGYNQAANMYARKADVVFAAAGGAGLGVLKASAAKHKYSIGVDSNQNHLHPKNILASDLKNVGKSIFDILTKYQNGTVKQGHTYVYGISNGGVSLVPNTALVPKSVVAKIAHYSKLVAEGRIQVPCVKGFCAKASG